MTYLPPNVVELLAGRPVTDFGPDDLAFAFRHRLEGLVFAADRESGGALSAALPLGSQRELTALAMARAQAAGRAETAVSSLFEAFADAELPLRVFKGAALARTLYSAPDARPHDDIDVLLLPSDWRSLRRAFEAVGVPPARASALRSLALRGRPIHEFEHPFLGVAIDFHFNPFGLLDAVRSPDLLAAEFTRHPSGLEICTAELSIVIAAVNLARKGGGALWHAADIARLLREDAHVRWDGVWQIADSEGIAKTVGTVLNVVVSDLGLARPNGLCVEGPRPAWAPRLGELNAQLGLRRRGTLVSFRRPIRDLPRAMLAFLRWYLPGPRLLDARGVAVGTYPKRLAKHYAQRSVRSAHLMTGRQ